ncbi:serine-protein kinase RsbW [Schinkia azotoformans MEV2011]|uniref:Serine-protein kinase RsbW n=1 Tax=Schinkia azotoformans MEV2011 TaxID=1348973 RepID=A0A072NMD2_SCHAZ|nr:anti-sigma B factor RsbW [Schinkia azotoformans]KEF38829.1 serine-protein kinase RsbW [Schinkia azotoformans MEV2011]MEC1693987.1 anti-sigma B factor RsbW [Schinkia azotoformans]MEC1714189.1 anti-sigma B factor RsbW [Schinkia azotoformans]MEC1724552.1 anti-sigma B factor RsbW [Schinkia azotoformans]MEC1742404.1 anti-sigma B factor RsbW [Schinkia azotoformans]
MKEPNEYIEMRVPAKPEYVGVIRLTASGIANRMGFSFEDIDDIKVAISEATTNAVDHAYGEHESGDVHLRFGIYEDRLEVSVADNGKSFNFRESTYKTEPYNKSSSIEEMREGGLGLFLMEALMDEVSINNESGGVVIVMTKHLTRDEVGHSGDTISTSESK